MIEVSHASVVSAVTEVSFSIVPGELVALVGPNGSGKSTLGKLLCAQILADSGSVSVDELDPARPSDRIRVRELVGMVCQNPADQLVSSVVCDEVGFGPRNIGADDDEIAARVADALDAVGLSGFEQREVNALSGGEQQRLALAGVLALEPRYVVFDEVSAMVDSADRPRIRSLVRHLVRTRSLGAVWITHDAAEVLACDRVVVLERGRVVWDGRPADWARAHVDDFERLLYLTPYARMLLRAVENGFEPVDGCEPLKLARWARQGHHGALKASARPCASSRSSERGPDAVGASDVARFDAALLEARGVSVSYEGRDVLSAVDVGLRPGTVTLVAGRSGSGKSTLARVLAGLELPSAGTVVLQGKEVRPGDVALAFQNPEQQLFLPTVREELAFAATNQGLDERDVAVRVEGIACELSLDDAFLASDPFALSGGQARRVALGSILALDAPALILDEPTAGLDRAGRASLHAIVAREAARGRAVMVISHDLEEWVEAADEVVLLAAGRVVWSGPVDTLAQDLAPFRAAGLEPPDIWALEETLAADSASANDVARIGDTVPATDAAPSCDVAPLAGAVRTGDAARERASACPSLDNGASVPEPSSPVPMLSHPLARVDARVKIVSLFCLIVSIFICQTPWSLAVWALVAMAACWAAGIGPARAAKAVRPALFLLCFIVAANLVSCDGTADVALAGPVGLDTAGGLRALLVVARIVIMLVLSLAVSFSTASTQIADACVRLARPLSRFGVPVDEVGIVLSLALRFIPLVSEELVRVRHAQEVRGVRFDEGSLVARITVWLSVLVPAVVGLFRRADRLAASMDARCYGSARRRPPAPRPLAPLDRVVLVCCIALAVVLAVFAR